MPTRSVRLCVLCVGVLSTPYSKGGGGGGVGLIYTEVFN